MLGKNPKSTVINEIKTDRNVFKDSNLIANKLNEYFVNIGPSLAVEVEKYHPTLASHANISNLENNTIFHFSEITIDQVLNNLKQLIPSKATGIDKSPQNISGYNCTILDSNFLFIITHWNICQ